MNFLHCGDIGDVIACLPVIRSMGGGNMLFTHKDRNCRESLRGARFESLRPLLEAQPYVDNAVWLEEPPRVEHIDFSTFRKGHKKGENLAQWQARHVGVPISESPWLIAEPSPKTKGRVLFARSKRYHNPDFPWDKIVYRFKDPLFVGLPDEYAAFQTAWGKPIESYTAKDLLELASLIKGCELLVCNQSCPFWIGAALGANIWQETWTTDPNSMIERDNIRYSINGFTV